MSTMKFKRSFSEANTTKSRKLKERIMNDVSPPTNGRPFHLVTMALYTFWLFNFAVFPSEQHNPLQEACIEVALRDTLERSKVLNWCRTIKRLYPLLTLGDGNCLLHAVSLGMWGCADSSLFLRRLVYVSLVEGGVTEKFHQRWRDERMKLDSQIPDGGLTLNTRDWDEEWAKVVSSADPDTMTQTDLAFDCLEEIHVFVLANILRRPIIILAEKVLRGLDGATFAPNNFSGIYLPLEWDPKDCVKCPLVLGYDMNHFSPLVSMNDKEGSDVFAIDAVHGVPLVDNDFAPLKMHFLSNQEEPKAYSLLSDYMLVDETPLSCSGSLNMVLYAKLVNKPLEDEFNLSHDYIQDCFDLIHNSVAMPAPMSPMSAAVKEQSRSIPSAPMASNISTAGIVEPFVEEVTPLLMNEPVAREPVQRAAPASTRRISTELSMTGEKCKTKSCKYYSSIETYPLCHRCNERNNHKKVEHMKPKSVPHMPIKEEAHHFSSLENYRQQPAVGGDGELCMTPGCKMYGLPEWSGYCSKHKVVPQVLAGGNVSLVQSHAVVEEARICKMQDCNDRSSSQYKGYCLKCYLHQSNDNTPCRSEGCMFAAGLNGFCSKCSEAEERRIMAASKAPSADGKCKWSDCTFNGSSEHMGYCSQHYKKMYGEEAVETLGTTNILERLPAQPAEEMAKAREFQKCKSHDCRRLASPGEDNTGYCPDCYVCKVRNKELPLLPKKNKCVTEGCRNKCLENSLGLCNSCFDEVKAMRDPRAKLQETRLSASGPESVIESMAGAPLLCKKKRCRNPQGGNMNGMCAECYKDFLADVQNMQIPQAEEPGKKCISSGCNNYGNDANGGLCNQCLSDVRLKPKGTPSKKMLRAHIGNPCRKATCTRYGDPAFQGFCSQCYDSTSRHKGLFAVKKPNYPVTYRTRSAPTLHQKTEEATMGIRFQKTMLAKENEARQSTAVCKNENCLNYSNSRCHGFCNTCYPLFARGLLMNDE